MASEEDIIGRSEVEAAATGDPDGAADVGSTQATCGSDESTGTLPEGPDPYFCEFGRLVYSCPQCGWYDDCPTSVPTCPQCRCFDEGGLVLKGHCEGKGRPHKAADHRLTPTKIGRALDITDEASPRKRRRQIADTPPKEPVGVEHLVILKPKMVDKDKEELTEIRKEISDLLSDLFANRR